MGDLAENNQRLIGDPLETDRSDRRPTCLIRDPLETDIPDRNMYDWSLIKLVGLRYGMLVSYEACWSPMWHGDSDES